MSFRLDVAVRRVLATAGRVTGVELDDGAHIDCVDLVVAAGAWSGELQGLPRTLPVHPVRGQMFAVEPMRIHDATDGTPSEFFTMSM